jgi:hypothetical protein
MIIKTPFGYIDLFQTWEGWTLIGAVVLALAVLAWMEWGKIWCSSCRGGGVLPGGVPNSSEIRLYTCPSCHGSGRVRRGWVSHFLRMASEVIRGKQNTRSLQ